MEDETKNLPKEETHRTEHGRDPNAVPTPLRLCHSPGINVWEYEQDYQPEKLTQATVPSFPGT